MIEQKAIDTILDNTVSITVDLKPKNTVHKLLQRFKIKPKQAVFEIKGATLRTMLRISKILLTIELKSLPTESNFLDYSYNAIEKELHKLAEVIAASIHNQKSEVPKGLVEMILDNMTATELKTISTIVIDKLNVIDFINTITSIRSVSLIEVSPTEAGGIIASGEQLEV